MCVAFFATAGWLLEGIDAAAHEEARAQGRLLARTLAASFAVPLARGQHEIIQRQIDQIAELPELFPQVVSVVVADQSQRVVAHTDPTRFNEPWHSQAPGAKETFLEDAGYDLPLLVMEAPVETAVRFGTVEVTLAPRGPFEAARRSSRALMAGMLVAVIALSAALVFAINLILVRPLRRVSKAVQEWKGDRTSLGIEGGPQEIRALVEAFDNLTERLNRQTEELEQKVEHRTRELKAVNRQLQKAAITDGLTGLANRRAFTDRLAVEVDRARRSARPLSLAFFDLDHFKRLNDTLGHLEGDAALAMLAHVLRQGRRSADLVARWGGEEFAVLLPETPHDDALMVAERIREAVEAAGLPAGCTISGGVATLPDQSEDARSLVAAADHALYASKEGGRNRITSAAASVATPRTVAQGEQ